MHYLMIPRSELKFTLACATASTFEQASEVFKNFVELYSHITTKHTQEDLKPDAINRIKELSGLTHPLRLKKYLANRDSIDNEEVLAILDSSDSYNGMTTFTDQAGVTHTLIAFQKKLLDYVAKNLSYKGDLDYGVQRTLRELEVLQNSKKPPTILNKPIEQVLNLSYRDSIFNWIQPTLTNFRSSLKSIKLFKSNYLDDEQGSSSNLVIEILVRYPDMPCSNEEEILAVFDQYLKDTLSWNTHSLNQELGTNLTAYEMLLQVQELSELGFVGLWPSPTPTIEKLTTSKTALSTSFDKEYLEDNPNIDFIVNVLSPLIEGEIKYLQEV